MDVDWQMIGSVGIFLLTGLICLIGFFLSCLSLSGTWLVLAAGGLLAWHNWPEFPGIGTLGLLLLICVGVEVAEALAAAWGVQRRGGSRAAGWAALGGGFLGMILGGYIPIPIIGNLIGMLAGSFACAYLVEHARLKEADHAAHVATGAVIARLSVIFIKIAATLAMICILVIGFIINR